MTSSAESVKYAEQAGCSMSETLALKYIQLYAFAVSHSDRVTQRRCIFRSRRKRSEKKNTQILKNVTDGR